ncbi:MAG: hypothetical protein Q8O56_00845 [Solirubrobacteraceae bacterium]|nr:hypothetical protein [Solirubrobacteraceae bacterium]
MATIAQPPPRPSSGEPPDQRVQAVGARAHVEHVAEEIPQPRWLEGLAIFLVAAGVYFWIGYETVVNDGVVVFDALDRLTRAYMVWHNDPPKLAAIGFVFPPLTTMAFLPFTVIKPVATSLVALPLASALFGGSMVVAMNRLLARCSMPGLWRWSLLAIFALNPMLVFYAGNGMSEVIYLALLTFSLYCFMSWLLTSQPRFVVAAALAFSLLVLLRYSFGIWALVIAVAMAVGLSRRGAANDEIEGTLVTYLAPLVYALGAWVLFNWLIVGDPLGWLGSSGAFAVNAPQADATGGVDVLDVMLHGSQLALGVFALGFVVIPALVLAGLSKRDEMSWWLALLAIACIVVLGAGALIEQDLDVLAMRNALPLLIVCVAGVAWLYRILPGLRTLIWVLAATGLLLTSLGSWTAMQHYPFQGSEQAFVRAIQSGEDQSGTNAIGGFRVGTGPEEQMAAYVNRNVEGSSTILADNAQTFGVILLSGRPQAFFDRVDRGDDAFDETVLRPHGDVTHLLMAKQVSGDLIRRSYPTAAARVAAGLTPVFETERYLLLEVADSDPRRPAAPGGATGGTGSGLGQVGGAAQGADGTPGTTPP